MFLEIIKEKYPIFQNMNFEYNENIGVIRLEKYNLIIDLFLSEDNVKNKFANINMVFTIPEIYEEGKAIETFKVPEKDFEQYLKITNEYNSTFHNPQFNVDTTEFMLTGQMIGLLNKSKAIQENFIKKIQIATGIVCLLTIDLWIYKKTKKRSKEYTEMEILNFANDFGLNVEDLTKDKQFLKFLSGE